MVFSYNYQFQLKKRKKEEEATSEESSKIVWWYLQLPSRVEVKQSVQMLLPKMSIMYQEKTRLPAFISSGAKVEKIDRH